MRIKAIALAALLSVAALVGCGTLRDANPIAVGCEHVKPATASLCGYSVYGTFVIAQETALKVATDVGPGGVRNAIIAAEDKAKPIGDKLNKGLVTYELIRQQAAAGLASPDQVAAALANIITLVDGLQPLVTDLFSAIAKAPVTTR